jgi:hypothetical protein
MKADRNRKIIFHTHTHTYTYTHIHTHTHTHLHKPVYIQAFKSLHIYLAGFINPLFQSVYFCVMGREVRGPGENDKSVIVSSCTC